MISIYSLPPFTAAIFSISLGGFVFFKNRKSSVHISFALFCLSLFIWLFGYTITYSIQDETVAVFFARLSCTGAMFTAPSCYYFSVSYLKRNKEKTAVLLSYLIFLLIAPFSMTSNYFLSGVYKYYWGYYSKAGMLHPLHLLIFFGIFIRSFWLLFYSYKEKRTTSHFKANQIQYIFYGYIAALIGAIDYIPKYGVEFYPFGFLFEIIFVSVIAYAILRYRLMDINLVFKRTAVYSLSAGILTSLFVVIVISMTKLLSERAGITSFTIMVIAAITIAILFNPLKNRIQKIIDKIFYKKTYDYYSTIQKVSHELASMLDLKKIHSFVGDTVFSTLGLKNIYLLSDVAGEDYEVVYHKSHAKKEKEEEEGKRLRIDGNCLMVKFLKTSEKIVIKYEMPEFIETLGQETIDSITTRLKPFNGEAVMPVVVDGKLSLLMIIGEKLSGDMFTNEDIKLIEIISDQTAIAIKTARLHQEKVHSERLASIGMMSATFAHEVRTPLTSIKTFAQLLPEKHPDIDFREKFSKIVTNSVDRIDGLINDLLYYSSDKIFVEMKNLDITELIDQTIDEVKTNLEFEKKNINIEKNYKKGKINILGDGRKLKHAILNIINNGCQAIPMDRNKGTLRIGINQDRESVDILITDNGNGISPKDMPKIFEPFFTAKAMGVGLGLAIAKKIVENHNGKIAVNSKLREGTTFAITLPVNNQEVGSEK